MSESHIKVIDFITQIRTRPGMYIGGLNDRGLLWTICSLLAEQVELSNGLAEVRIFIEDRLSVRLELDGVIRGVAAHLCDTIRHAGMLLRELSVASALCESLEIEFVQEGQHQNQTFSRGIPISLLEVRASDVQPNLKLVLRFDSQLFPPTAQIRLLALCGRFQEFAIFNRQTNFVITDSRTAMARNYRYEHGLRSYLEEFAFDEFDSRLDTHPMHRQALYCMELREGESAAEAVIYKPCQGRDSNIIRSFVNGQRTLDHGTHVQGLLRGCSEVVEEMSPVDWGQTADYFKPVLLGAVVLVSVSLPEPHWAGSVKCELSSADAGNLVYRMVKNQLPDQMRKNLRP